MFSPASPTENIETVEQVHACPNPFKGTSLVSTSLAACKVAYPRILPSSCSCRRIFSSVRSPLLLQATLESLDSPSAASANSVSSEESVYRSMLKATRTGERSETIAPYTFWCRFVRRKKKAVTETQSPCSRVPRRGSSNQRTILLCFTTVTSLGERIKPASSSSSSVRACFGSTNTSHGWHS